jgi:hypothetical protein
VRRLAVLVVALFVFIFPFAVRASASTSYTVNYHGAYIDPWAWTGTNNYVQKISFSIKDVTGSRICPRYGVEGPGYLWSTTSCANPGGWTGHTWQPLQYVQTGTYTMFISMPGWPTLDHTFTVS